MIYYTDKHKIPFQIDEEDYESVYQYSWYIGSGYPTTSVKNFINGICINRRTLYLHEFLLGKAGNGLEWDHIDRNKLNNCRKNIRAVKHGINIFNRDPNRSNTSGYVGIWWNSDRCKWVVNRAGGKRYDTLEEAIEVRRKIELKEWGESRLSGLTVNIQEI